MDYTAWCDDILVSLAEWLRQRPHGLYGHLEQFAKGYLDSKGLPFQLQDSVIDAALDVFGAFGLPDNDRNIHLKYGDLEILTNAYGRWEAVFRLDIDQAELLLINAVNHLSLVEEHGGWVVTEVHIHTVLKDPAVQSLLQERSEEHVREMLDALHHHKLVSQYMVVSGGKYEATYCGFTRLHRAQILAGREVDELRLQGESDSLDYKRVLDVTSNKGKSDFAKDAVAFANTGGSPAKHILVGVNDDGTFHQPADPEVHRKAVHSLEDTTLQQIVSDRTLHAPSITIKGKGDHLRGPYTLIEITCNPANVPYRYFANPADSRAEGASQAGEVWVRKGTIKHLASPDEIADLERRAADFRETFPGRP